MAQRFTLKDNPIFQRTEVPVPQPKTAADLDKDSARSGTSEPEVPSIPAPTTRVDITQVKNTPVESTQVNYTQVEIAHVNIAVNYYRMDNEVNDRLALLQTPSEQVVYQRLYRLSYGFHRNVCQVSIHTLRDQTNLKSDKTVKTALQGLISKKHIARIGGPNYSPTGGNTYRVYLPHEILPGPSKTKVEITQVETPLPTQVETTQVNFASQNMIDSNLLHNNDTHSACVLEDKFANLNPKTLDQLLIQYGITQVQLAMDVLNYQWQRGQGTQPSAPVAVLKSVLAEGVTIPEGFVSREQRQAIQQRERDRKEQQRRDEKRRQEEEKKLKALREQLSAEDLRHLREKAEERIGQELDLKRGELGFTTMLVKAKEDELLREQYLNQG